MLEIKNLHKTFTVEKGQVRAVAGVDLDIADGEFFVLLGPSGSGKSTVLRCVAGLERPEKGEISIDGQIVSNPEKNIWVAPHERPLGMVFQSYAIWPHMTVARNVSFPLEQGRNKLPKNQIKAAVDKALEQVKLTVQANRPAPLLSGGQQQRVALARAIVTNPKIFLFDEPLSNLDAKLREEMRVELGELTHSLGIAALYVTHDQAEALAMADRVGVIVDGNILELGPPRDMYLRPRTRYVADFLGSANKFLCKVVKAEYPIGVVESELGPLEVSLYPGAAVGAEVEVGIRPENVICQSERPAGPNVFRGVVERCTFMGSHETVQLKIGDKQIYAVLKGEEVIIKGQEVWVQFPPDHCLALQ